MENQKTDAEHQAYEAGFAAGEHNLFLAIERAFQDARNEYDRNIVEQVEEYLLGKDGNPGRVHTLTVDQF